MENQKIEPRYTAENTSARRLKRLVTSFKDHYNKDDNEWEFLLNVRNYLHEGFTVQEIEQKFPDFWHTLNSITDGYAPPDPFAHINTMDPVDFERGLFEDFQTFMLRAYKDHGQCTKDDIDHWLEETAHFYDQPGIDETFNYTADEIRKVIDYHAELHCFEPETEKDEN